MKTLRPYQKKAVTKILKALRDGERPLCYAPTGAGKTVIAAEVLRPRSRSGLVDRVFVVHTDQLKEQVRAELASAGVPGVMVETIQALLHKDLPRSVRDFCARAAVVCVDECHHLKGETWRQVVELFAPDCSLFGLSATPHDKELFGVFSCRIDIALVEDLLRGGWIAPVGFKRPSPESEALRRMRGSDKISGAEAYALTPELRSQQALHFEPEVTLCEEQAARYAALGVPAAVVHGKTKRTERELAIQEFREGRLNVLISPVLLTEGFDAPCASLLIAGRAFASPTLLWQAVGRVRRPFPGKTEAYVLDCVGFQERKGLAADYFSHTDQTLMTTTLPEYAERGAGDGSGSRAGRGARAATNWIVIPPEEWITESSVSQQEMFSRVEHADMIERVQKLSADITEAQISARREYQRKRLADPAKRAAKRATERESERKRLADPAKRAADREARSKRLTDPTKRSAKCAADRESRGKRLADPAKRAARNEEQRKYRAAKKAQAAHPNKEPHTT